MERRMRERMSNEESSEVARTALKKLIPDLRAMESLSGESGPPDAAVVAELKRLAAAFRSREKKTAPLFAMGFLSDRQSDRFWMVCRETWVIEAGGAETVSIDDLARILRMDPKVVAPLLGTDDVTFVAFCGFLAMYGPIETVGRRSSRFRAVMCGARSCGV
jgi:hypothetical protein